MKVCPVCEKQNKKSKVYYHGESATYLCNLPFFDEDGVEHYHDNNITTTTYKCSNLHMFDVESKSLCPAVDCDYNKNFEEISIILRD